MIDLALRTQGLLQSLLEALNSLPFWFALGILFAPTLLSLLTRRWITIVATALLNLAGLILLTAGQNSGIAGPLMIVTFAASLVFALFGFYEHQVSQQLSSLDARVARVEEQIMTFLRALEGRSDMIDQKAEQARMAFRDAHKAFEDLRKPPKIPTASSQLGPQGLQTVTSGDAPQRATGVGTEGTSTPPVPPTPKV